MKDGEGRLLRWLNTVHLGTHLNFVNLKRGCVAAVKQPDWLLSHLDHEMGSALVPRVLA